MPHRKARTADIEQRLLIDAIYHRYHYDFRGYAQASLKRRLASALVQFDCKTLSQLQDRVLHEPAVFPALLEYLTVQVSDMFRDPSYFKALREKVLPHAAESGVFDLSRVAAFTENHARSGARSSLSDYYAAAYGRVVFDKGLREHMVFSDHSLATDSVFAEVHLVSCRNVLIYFERDLQDRALGLFRESLCHRGFLGLGSKESLRFSAHTDAFDDFVPQNRIYRKKAGL